LGINWAKESLDKIRDELDKKYIIIQNIINKEKFILHYYTGISEDTYGEITDPKEFDFVVSTFQSIE